MANHPVKPATLTDRQKQYFPITMNKPDTGGVGGFSIAGGIGMLLGIAVVCVGGYIIMFGPDYIRYSRFAGPTFYQFIELYPGPITTAGFLIVALAHRLFAKGTAVKVKLQTEAMVKALASKGIRQDDLGDDYRLRLEEAAGNRVSIVLVDNKTADANTIAPNAPGDA